MGGGAMGGLATGYTRTGNGQHTGLPTGCTRACYGRHNDTAHGQGTDGKTGAQGGEKAHHLLHTGYKQIDVYKFAE